MEKIIKKTGKTIEDAIRAALDELELEKDQVEIEIIDEGSKGFFGLGSKPARVLVTQKETAQERAEKFLMDVFNSMDLKVDLEFKENGNNLKIDMLGEHMGILIGRRGETLDSLQYLTSLVVNRGDKDYVRISIDTENYRKRREVTLEKLARRLADRVLKYRRNVTLEPMNPYERRIIHSTLQNNKMVNTYSVGEEPNRKVVIAINSHKK